MAKSLEMSAKGIAALFRGAVEAEDNVLLGDTSTFAEQDFLTQLGWFTNQIEARLKKNTPSPNVLALMAALGGAIGRSEPESCIDAAYQIWQASDAKIREATLCSREEIEENLSQVGVDFRLAPWPENDDGTDRKNLEVTPFLRLCIPLSTTDSLEKHFKKYLKENPLGEKPRTSAQVEKKLKKIKEKRLVPNDRSEMGSAIVAWWMKQKEFKPLNFPDRS
ncbi:hypothetical protein N9085_03375, partial [Akkermansiaceae bacterium]|nr:hypothetical protein [Akkermansiaceae bacterium]